jgi:hypothetical protein
MGTTATVLPVLALLLYYLQAVFVVANKADMPGRKVSEQEGRAWAAARGYPYVEVH